MITLTQEKREELIEWIREHIEFLKQNGHGSTYAKNSIIALEITLSSLTTKAIGKVNLGDVSDNNEYPDAKVDCIQSQVGWDNFQDRFLLFTAPPVPEIKLPELMDYADPPTQYCEGIVDGYNRCLAEIKRLNGWGD